MKEFQVFFVGISTSIKSDERFFSPYFLSDEIYRFNLEQGKFQTSLKTKCTLENNCCEFNKQHELFVCGNTDGLVECWDPRTPPRQVATLDCCLDVLFEDSSAPEKRCSVTALKFRDALNLAVGTSTGHVC